MNYKWVIEAKNGSTVKPRDEKDKVTPYTEAPLKDAKNFGLEDEQGNIKVVIFVPDGAVVFQRRRTVKINYNNKFVTINEAVPAYVDGQGILRPEKKTARTVPETTYEAVWLIGYRLRNNKGDVEIQFKAVYPDDKIEEYKAFGGKPWLYEPEWLTEEQV